MIRRFAVLPLLLSAASNIWAACVAPSFRGPVVYPAGDAPSVFTLANLNGNGPVDAVVGSGDLNGDGGGLSVLPRTGAAFGAARSVSTDVFISVAAADFDRDGDDDIVAVALQSGIVAFRNDHGELEQQNVWTGPARTVTTGDFDGDGNPDFVVATDNPVAVVLYRGLGDGSFQQDAWDGPIVDSFARLTVADLNRDGRDDIAAIARTSSSVLVLFGAPSGGFSKPVTHTFDFDPRETYVADVDGDGDIDLLVEFTGIGLIYVDFVTISTGISHVLTWLSVTRGNGDGTFQPMTDVRLTHYAETLTFGDFNGDQFPDVSFSHLFLEQGGRSAVAISLNDRTGGFRQFVEVGPIYEGVPTSADLDQDGYDDLIFTGPSFFDAFITVAMSRGDGTFSAEQRSATGLPSAARTEVNDFNGDGHPDILVIEETNTTVRIGRASFLSGDGKGALAPPLVIATTGVGGVFAGDFDGDGHVDIVDAGFVRPNDCVDVRPRRRTVRH